MAVEIGLKILGHLFPFSSFKANKTVCENCRLQQRSVNAKLREERIKLQKRKTSLKRLLSSQALCHQAVDNSIPHLQHETKKEK